VPGTILDILQKVFEGERITLAVGYVVEAYKDELIKNFDKTKNSAHFSRFCQKCMPSNYGENCVRGGLRSGKTVFGIPHRRRPERAS